MALRIEEPSPKLRHPNKKKRILKLIKKAVNKKKPRKTPHKVSFKPSNSDKSKHKYQDNSLSNAFLGNLSLTIGQNEVKLNFKLHKKSSDQSFRYYVSLTVALPTRKTTPVDSKSKRFHYHRYAKKNEYFREGESNSGWRRNSLEWGKLKKMVGNKLI
jgi:hypothetical protein